MVHTKQQHYLREQILSILITNEAYRGGRWASAIYPFVTFVLASQL